MLEGAVCREALVRTDRGHAVGSVKDEALLISLHSVKLEIVEQECRGPVTRKQSFRPNM